MACLSPLQATRLVGGRINIHKRTDVRKPTEQRFGKDIALPCGRCIGCRLDRATQWATRCLHEKQMHANNCALTLTYGQYDYEFTREDRDSSRQHQDMLTNEKSALDLPTITPERLLNASNIVRVDKPRLRTSAVPYGVGTRAPTSMWAPDPEELSLIDHQKFIKRLRAKIQKPVRFYMCGEYGAKLLRPHYHYIIFGYDFPDKKYFKTSLSGTKLFRSAELEEIWTAGHAWIGDVDYDTCAYVASYMMKKQTGNKAEDHYRRTDEAGNDYWIMPEYNQMSRDPGIAKEWWMKFHKDVTTTDGVWRHDLKTKPPRYYDKLLEKLDPVKYGVTKMMREHNAQNHKEDSSPARLQARELVLTAKVNMKKRKLENESQTSRHPRHSGK